MNKLYECYIAIDDTDELGYHTSTGEICDEIRKHITQYYGQTTPVTRHQLFLHPDIPYTSHNSSMCFTCYIKPEIIEEVKIFVSDFVTKQSAPSAAAGICIGFSKDILHKDELLKYATDAKKNVLTHKLAYEVADKSNLYLRALTPNENGIIGALAGIGLRLSGNDGRLKGKIKLNKEIITSRELLNESLFQAIHSLDSTWVDLDKPIQCKEYLKGVILNTKITLLLRDDGDYYRLLSREELAEY